MTDSILNSLEIISESHGDITDQVYARYFAECAGSQALMEHMDPGVKGKMMQEVMRLLMVDDYKEEESYLNFEIDYHQSSFSVEHHMYANLFNAVKDVVKDGLGEQWTDEMNAAWQTRVENLVSEVEHRALGCTATSAAK